MVGTLIPTLPDDAWNPGRKTAGAGWLGTSLGAAGAALAARAVDAEAGQVAVVSGAGMLGLGIGAGAGWMWPDKTSQPVRIGLVAGSTGMMAAGVLAERAWRLSDTLDRQALPLGLFGAAVGAANGYLVGRVLAPDDSSPYAYQQKGGGVLLGASAGLATGVLTSRWVRPTFNDYLGMTGASALGHWAGLGVAELAFGNDGIMYIDPAFPPPVADRREPILRLAGALTGLGAGALVARQAPLRSPDLLAGLVGTGYGAVIGTLVPSLDRDVYVGGDPGAGGAHLGAAIGGAAATAAAHLTDASAAQIMVPSVATGLGGLAGLGLGQLLPAESSQDQRLASLAGMLTFGGASIALERPLRLTEGFRVPRSFALSATGLIVGNIEGTLLANLIDHPGPVDGPTSEEVTGGMLLGNVLGASTGFVLARFIQPTVLDGAVALGGGLAGAGLGVGLAMTTTDQAGRADTAGALAGSLLGLGGLALTQRSSPLQDADFMALPVGAAFGGLFGRLLPTLDDVHFGPLDRTAGGGLLTGISGGALAAVATRHLTDARPVTVGLTALGGTDGLLTGLGVGLLVDDPGESRGQRIGAVAGAAAGLGIGAGLWPQLDWRGTDPLLLGSLTALGAWNGLLAPRLGHASSDSVDGQKTAGGLLVGAGAGSLLATALVPALDLDADLIANALAMDVVLGGAGAGTGALISQRDDAPVWGALAGGAAGLLLGGGLHRAIEIDERRQPLLTLAPIEGLWFGGWLPFLLYERERVGPRQFVGGLAAGGLGGAALATLAGSALELDASEAGSIGLTTAIGASLAGGSALIADGLPARARVGLLLGGSGAGLLAGALGVRDIDLRSGGGYASVGSVLGASEGLVFAWAGRADGSADYAGAALVGAGVGSTLGLVVASNPRWMQGRGLPAAGFAGWGAWMGAFGGALINRDPHEVTLGGLAGANAGMLSGLGLLASGLVEPRDFGWLSAFGAGGTVLGGGVGALFSTRTDPRPALAGLLVGPAVGLATGALVLPHLRGIGRADAPASPSSATSDPDPAPSASYPTSTPSAAATLPSSPELWEASRGREQPTLTRNLRRSFGVSQLMPVIGSLPPTDPAAGPAPFVVGVAGLWH
jgi:hypothetical protein